METEETQFNGNSGKDHLHENHLVQDSKLLSTKTSELIEHIQNT